MLRDREILPDYLLNPHVRNVLSHGVRIAEPRYTETEEANEAPLLLRSISTFLTTWNISIFTQRHYGSFISLNPNQARRLLDESG
jgi:hypothetical protein